jgi:hypothetical protein
VIEDRLYTLLVPNVIAQLSEIQAPQSIGSPYSVLSTIGQVPIAAQDQAYSQGLRVWMIEFHSYGRTPLLARTEAVAIRDYLVGYHGSGADIKVCFVESSRMGWDDDTKLARCTYEYRMTESLG